MIQDSQGISSTTAGNVKTVVQRIMTKLSAELIDTDLKFAVAKYATSRQMSCFGSADETISYMDNKYQHEGSGFNQLNLALSKMVMKQFDKRPDDRKEDTTRVSFTFGFFRFGQSLCDDVIQVICIIYLFYQNCCQSRTLKILKKGYENQSSVLL